MNTIPVVAILSCGFLPGEHGCVELLVKKGLLMLLSVLLYWQREKHK